MFYAALIFCIVISFLLADLFSRLLIKHAKYFHIGKRVFAERIRLHSKGVPRLGGLAIYSACCLTILFVYLIYRPFFAGFGIKLIFFLLSSSVLAIGCGLYDDIINRISYRTKFLIQILAILLLLISGYSITSVSNPLGGSSLFIGWFGIPFFVLWMLFIINALNLVDGLDGLACGISLIACCSFLIMQLFSGQTPVALIIAAFIGAGLAFLRFNFYPAKLFLGDSGSLFLGLMIGMFSVECSFKRAAVISLIVPFLTLLIPLGSVIFTVSRRISQARNPFLPDKWHLHYRFMHAGISHRDTVLIYYSATFFYTLLGLFGFFMPKRYELFLILFAGLSMWGFYLWALYFINRKKGRSKRKIGRNSAA